MTANATVLLNRLQARARLRHLQVLVKLGELRNLRAGAEALGLSQPAVTQVLADLERLLDVRLFERHSRGVRLTAAGAELMPLARRMLDTLAECCETVTALRQQGEGVVRAAAVASAVNGLLGHALPGFARQHPNIQVQVRDCDVDQWALLLARGEADLAVCRAAGAAPAGFAFHPLVDDRFVIACGPGHPLARRRRVGWDRLARERWLPAPVGSNARRVFDEQMQALGASPALCQVVTRAPTLTWALLRADRLVTLVPYGVVRAFAEAGQLVVIEPEPALPFTPIGLMLPEGDGTEALKTFTRYLVAHAGCAAAGAQPAPQAA